MTSNFVWWMRQSSALIVIMEHYLSWPPAPNDDNICVCMLHDDSGSWILLVRTFVGSWLHRTHLVPSWISCGLL